MKRVVVGIGGLLLALVLSSTAASAQDSGANERHLWWSVEGAAGVQIQYTGTIQSIAVGFAPTRSLTLLVSAERSHLEDEVEFYPDGYSSTRGGQIEFISGEVRFAFFANTRVSPYVVGGWGRGMERPNVNELFPYGVDRKIVAIYYGGGARIPIHRRLDGFVDWRLIITGDDASEMAVVGPLRAGLAFRF